MERSELMSIIDTESRSTKIKSKKRKWREIEAIKDQHNYRSTKEILLNVRGI